MKNLYYTKSASHPPKKITDKLSSLDEEYAGWILENWSMEGLENDSQYRHISEIALESDEDARRSAQHWVADLSDRILESTGKAVEFSFDYRGVNAWWFLEIIFHEPAYLIHRRKVALNSIHDSYKVRDWPLFEDTSTDFVLPQMPRFEKRQSFFGRLRSLLRIKFKAFPTLLRAWVKMQVSKFFYYRGLSKLTEKSILFIFEYENLRRHKDVHGRPFTVLPYAEGVAEKIHDVFGTSATILAKQLYPNEYETWGFVDGVTPKPIVNELPLPFKKALRELYGAAEDMLQGYYSLEDLENIFAYKLAEFDTYVDILKRVQPDVLFIYNWEGVFRPLIAAARKNNCKVAGIQQALGPYLHALDHSSTTYQTQESSGSFCVPDVFMLWGSEHEKKMISYGYPAESLVVTGYPRLDRHFQITNSAHSDRNLYCKMLGLDPNKRFLIFTGQHRVLDTALILRNNYKKTLQLLVKLAVKYDFSVIIKPWSGDDIAFISELCHADDTGRVYIAPQDVMLHNAELLSICDWCVGTFSSFLGEAVLSGVASLMLDYPESRYYFGKQHQDIYKKMLPFVTSPEGLIGALTPLIESDGERLKALALSQGALEGVFGPCDGNSSQRVIDVLKELLVNK